MSIPDWFLRKPRGLAIRASGHVQRVLSRNDVGAIVPGPNRSSMHFIVSAVGIIGWNAAAAAAWNVISVRINRWQRDVSRCLHLGRRRVRRQTPRHVATL